MKRNTVMLGLALTVAALAAAVSLGWHPFDAGRAAAAPLAQAGDGADGGAALPSMLATPQGRQFQQRRQFQDEAKRFFSDAKTLGPAERERRAQTLRAQIDRYEQADELSAGETMLLRVGLIQATVPDEAQQALMVQRLAQQYRAQARAREQAWVEQQAHDPKFQAYKRSEAQIVAETLKMQRFPDGLTRDEYLRRRLQAERERIYR
ncbi:hypothetical protein J5226_20725 [Lysobacter sp. K5869]|uniref:hypothetical protein n=1 Tax=Lysobacter sp. K5869 TaxID=2820808 RepID=UPI001C061A4A|nr:hypothetical protein [Lysobacter sp. K5869]QWP76001.1 hypothetical protein J5226_20725 [Lysobacter sp. K5869]